MSHTENEILAGLTEIVAEETGWDGGQLTPELSFADDLQVDSLSLMTVVVEAEERFQVRLDNEDLSSVVTVGDAVEFIRKANVMV
jgi:acyl carrier protein